MIQWVLRTAVGAQAGQALRCDRPAERRREWNEGGIAPQHRLGLTDLYPALAGVDIDRRLVDQLLRLAVAERIAAARQAAQSPQRIVVRRDFVDQAEADAIGTRWLGTPIALKSAET